MIKLFFGSCLTRLPRKARAGRVDQGPFGKNPMRFTFLDETLSYSRDFYL